VFKRVHAKRPPAKALCRPLLADKTARTSIQSNKETTMNLPSVEELKGKWKQQMGAAKIAWGKLTDDELLQSEGHAEKLAGLIETRYAVTCDEAARQVKAFFARP
jgi:uncharacterized protein YjbJ (UPF0337 family)